MDEFDQANTVSIPEQKPEPKIANPNLSYYSKPYATNVKPFVDKMMEDNEEQVFSPNAVGKKTTLNTLYVYLHRAMLYLCDHMDDEKKTYTEWRKTVMLRKDEEDNVVRLIPKGLRIGTVTQPSVKQNAAKDFNWKEQVDDYIENGPDNTQLKIDGLVLGDDDIGYIKSSLCGLSGFKCDVDNNHILIQKRKVEL